MSVIGRWLLPANRREPVGPRAAALIRARMATYATRYAADFERKDIDMQTILRLMVGFQPDARAAEPNGPIETALFLGVRDEPALESTQLRWQVRVHPSDVVQLENGTTYLENLGGALFLTTKGSQPETPSEETRGPIGWMEWIGDLGRRSFQIQLAISGVGFDRVCDLAAKGRYPEAILTFKDDGRIEHGLSPDGNKKIWNNEKSRVALISEFTLRYDFSPRVHASFARTSNELAGPRTSWPAPEES
jgi:hypothetical protein